MKTFTFKDSGVTANIRKVSPLLSIELRKVFPPPTPPLNKVTDLNGNERTEYNEADPDYQQALIDYNAKIESETSKLLIHRGVGVDVDKAAVDEIKAYWQENYGKALSGTDKEIYVYYCLCTSADEFQELVNEIMSVSQPTAEDVNRAKQSFQS